MGDPPGPDTTKPGRGSASPSERPDDLGRVALVRGFLRRRVGLWWVRMRHHRLRGALGAMCVRGHASGWPGAPEFALVRGVSSTEGSTSSAEGVVDVGDRTVFGHHCTVAADQSIVIGRGCLLAEMVSVPDHDHAFADPDRAVLDQGRTTDPMRIGDNVWLGAKVAVTKGVTIGSNVVLGAHAVVTADLPDGCGGGDPGAGHRRPGRETGARSRLGGLPVRYPSTDGHHRSAHAAVPGRSLVDGVAERIDVAVVSG
jgi:acetyltransferase-like isoleucine patch superfamily enzyme